MTGMNVTRTKVMDAAENGAKPAPLAQGPYGASRTADRSAGAREARRGRHRAVSRPAGRLEGARRTKAGTRGVPACMVAEHAPPGRTPVPDRPWRRTRAGRAVARCAAWVTRTPAAARRTASDAGMATSEYAVGLVAAVAFAGVLYKVVTSPAVQAMLASLVGKALHVQF